MTTILVTGGAGFMGSNFIRWMLQARPHRIVNLDLLTYAANLENLASIESDPRYRFVRGDIRDRQLLARVFADFGVDVVVNFAAESYVDRSVLDPEIFLQVNLAGAQALLDTAVSAWRSRLTGGHPDTSGGPVRFIQISTAEVYGDLGPDGQFVETSPLEPKTPYAASKAGADLLVSSYGDAYGLPTNIVRFSIGYGPFQLPEKLIPGVIDSVLAAESPRIYGDGHHVRDWLHVSDACTAIDSILNGGRIGGVYNVGGRSPRSTLDVVAAVTAALGKGGPQPMHQADRVGNDRRIVLDVAKVEAELGWRPSLSFEQGVAQTVAWYLARPDWIRRVKSGVHRATQPSREWTIAGQTALWDVDE